MKPTDDEAQPRRDGWFEHAGTWEEVTVGTVIGNAQRRTERWEIVDVAMSTPVPFMHTLWMRAREQTTGAEFTVKPRTKVNRVTILTQDPLDTKTPAITPPSDADAIMLVVEKLGATLLASRDEKTGEITCPDYTYDSHLEGDGSILRGLIEHMNMAHDAKAPANLSLLDAVTAHGRMHNFANIGKTTGGFPHRHVEDMQLVRGIR